jgi:CDP-diacylglycerol--serine O-phosphatidyltransferase
MITTGNLVAGCIGIYFALNGEFMSSAYCIGIAALFDFLDGLVARLLKVHSEIGKQLDSLADMVTFGVLPSFIMFQYLSAADAGNWKFIAFAIAVFSAFRLAKFNVDTRQSDQFIGLPTPANAIFICSLIFLKDIPGFDFLFEKTALSIVVTIFSLLLVAEIPMIALKFKSLKFKENIFRYILILGAITLVVLFQFSGIPFVIAFYILLSVVNNIVASRN